MNKFYIELRTRNNFGDIINNYFTFLKYNFKEFTNLYLKYNAVSIVFALITAYMLVTGFMGLASRDFRFGMGSDTEGQFFLIAGGILLVLVLFITTLINYSFSSAYITSYTNNRGHIDSKDIWQRIKNNLGTIVLLVLVGVVIYIGYFIISMVLAFIPLLGMLVQYGLSFALNAFFGITFMAIFAGKTTIGDAIGEGWNFTFSNFFKIILYSLVIGILNLMITWIILSVPTFILGIYIYFSATNEVDIISSGFASILFTFGFAIFILAFIYSQALMQIAYGVLFYNLHEDKYNIFLRKKIEQIGLNE